VSNVETAKRLMASSASGFATDARTPIASSGNGPWSFRRAQPRSTWSSTPPRSGGRQLSSHTIDSSSAVRVTDVKALPG
jgi:hypothetical protein